jgi:hypothetical protein
MVQSLSHASEPKNLSPILGMLMDDEGPARSTVIFQDSFESDEGWVFDLSAGEYIGDSVDVGRGEGKISDGFLNLLANQNEASSSFASASKTFETARTVDNFTWKLEIPFVATSSPSASVLLELKYDGLKVFIPGVNGRETLIGFECLIPSCEEVPITLLVTYRNGVLTASQNDNPSVVLNSAIVNSGDGLSEVKISTNADGEDSYHYASISISEIKLSSF